MKSALAVVSVRNGALAPEVVSKLARHVADAAAKAFHQIDCVKVLVQETSKFDLNMSDLEIFVWMGTEKKVNIEGEILQNIANSPNFPLTISRSITVFPEGLHVSWDAT